MRVDVGSVEDLTTNGCLTGKAGTMPVCVFWHDGRAYAVDDRCPHMGFPLHRGTVENGLVTCHWHHARFDLASGGTLDPFADDVRAYPVELDGDRVVVLAEPQPDRVAHLYRRLEEGLEQGLTLVTAKAVLGLLDSGQAPGDIVAAGVDFGVRYRREGFGSGLVVLTAMANLLPHLAADDRAPALVHGLAFVSRDTRGHVPRFPLEPLTTRDVEPDRLVGWYRRFIDTRSADAAERALVTAIAAGHDDAVAHMLWAAATDHVFLDGGHTVDITNKAFESLEHVGKERAGAVLPSLVFQTARAGREEVRSEWRHPHDLVGLVARAEQRLAVAPDAPGLADDAVAALGWQLLADEPPAVIDALVAAAGGGATLEQLARAVAFAASLRIVRFHTQNDHGDWDVVHHGLTAASGVHHAVVRTPVPELVRAVVHGALKVYLDRFLNVPAARLPTATSGDLADLGACWDEQGRVDEAGTIVHGFLAAGGDPAEAIAALGHALLAEDAEFHWFQTVEAAVQQFHAWPRASVPARLILVGAARFLAAHTPTRRELPQVVRIATRLRRGEALYEEA
ncbi:MAG: Rieske 2Fe-2S domain-containing protein [Acidimicrobiales bacterium]